MGNTKKETAKTKQKKYTKLSFVGEFLKESKWYFIISIAAVLLVNLFEMIIPQVIRSTVDSVIGDAPLDLPDVIVRLVEQHGGVAYLRSHLWIICLVIVVLAIGSAVFRYLNTLYNSKGTELFVRNMRNRLFSHIQRLPFSWHMKNQTGDIIQRCTSDVDMIKNFVSEQLTSVFRIIMMIILSLVFMFSMNIKLTLVAAVFMPIVIAYSFFFHTKISDRFTKCDENEGVLSTIAQENLTGIRVVRAFGREKFEKERFEKQNQIYTNEWMKLCTFLSLFWGTGDLVSGLQIMSIVVLGSYFCVSGQMTAGEFIAFASDDTAFSETEWKQLGTAMEELKKFNELYCTGCKYCQPCPAGIVIPKIFEMYTYYNVYGLKDHAKKMMQDYLNEGGKTYADCLGCGQCEKQCPQHLPIREKLEQVCELLCK